MRLVQLILEAIAVVGHETKLGLCLGRNVRVQVVSVLVQLVTGISIYPNQYLIALRYSQSFRTFDQLAFRHLEIEGLQNLCHGTGF